MSLQDLRDQVVKLETDVDQKTCQIENLQGELQIAKKNLEDATLRQKNHQDAAAKLSEEAKKQAQRNQGENTD